MNINFKQISFITFFIITFYQISIKLISIFDPLKILYWKLLQHCPSTEIIPIPLFTIWWFFIFIIIFHTCIISFCILIICMAYSRLLPRNFGKMMFERNWEKSKYISQHAMQVLNAAGVQVFEPRGRFQECGGFWCESLETPAIIRYI